MNKISITDITLRRATETGALGFKEKLEIAKCLDRVNISAIELASLTESKADSIFVKTLASLIRKITPEVPITICQHEPFSGAHVGPGMLGLFFRGVER